MSFNLFGKRKTPAGMCDCNIIVSVALFCSFRILWALICHSWLWYSTCVVCLVSLRMCSIERLGFSALLAIRDAVEEMNRIIDGLGSIFGRCCFSASVEVGCHLIRWVQFWASTFRTSVCLWLVWLVSLRMCYVDFWLRLEIVEGYVDIFSSANTKWQ